MFRQPTHIIIHKATHRIYGASLNLFLTHKIRNTPAKKLKCGSPQSLMSHLVSSNIYLYKNAVDTPNYPGNN